MTKVFVGQPQRLCPSSHPTDPPRSVQKFDTIYENFCTLPEVYKSPEAAEGLADEALYQGLFCHDQVSLAKLLVFCNF